MVADRWQLMRFRERVSNPLLSAIVFAFFAANSPVPSRAADRDSVLSVPCAVNLLRRGGGVSSLTRRRS